MSKKRILIVEDEIIIALDIRNYLEKINCEVTSINTTYEEAIESFKKELPDVVLLDINLGGVKDGLDVAEKINSINKTPIIFITAFSSLETIKKAAVYNPTSFLVKPIKREELRINIMIAFSNKQNADKDSKNVELFKGCTYDLENEVLTKDTKAIKISKNEKKLLKLLIENKNQMVYISEIESEIWSKKDISDSLLRTLVYRLRKKLDNSCIETVSNVGYKLNIL